MRSLRLIVRDIQTPDPTDMIAVLRTAPDLHTLMLKYEACPFSEMGAGGAEVLAGLLRARRLHTLRLHLAHSRLGDAGAAALCAVCRGRARPFVCIVGGCGGVGPAVRGTPEERGPSSRCELGGGGGLENRLEGPDLICPH